MADEGGRGRGHGRGRGRGAPVDPPPPPPLIQPVTVEQLMLMQAQLMQTMIDCLDHQPDVVPPPVQVRDKRGEFMKGRRPIFTHAIDPLEADDWLRAVEKQLNIAQCNEVEVLYASRQLQGATQECNYI